MKIRNWFIQRVTGQSSWFFCFSHFNRQINLTNSLSMLFLFLKLRKRFRNRIAWWETKARPRALLDSFQHILSLLLIGIFQPENYKNVLPLLYVIVVIWKPSQHKKYTSMNFNILYCIWALHIKTLLFKGRDVLIDKCFLWLRL